MDVTCDGGWTCDITETATLGGGCEVGGGTKGGGLYGTTTPLGIPLGIPPMFKGTGSYTTGGCDDMLTGMLLGGTFTVALAGGGV